MSETKQIVERLENYYDFQCEAGPLRNCVEWQTLKVEIDQARQQGWTDALARVKVAVERVLEWLETHDQGDDITAGRIAAYRDIATGLDRVQQAQP